jgi:uncharacterized membrane protein
MVVHMLLHVFETLSHLPGSTNNGYQETENETVEEVAQNNVKNYVHDRNQSYNTTSYQRFIWNIINVILIFAEANESGKGTRTFPSSFILCKRQRR